MAKGIRGLELKKRVDEALERIGEFGLDIKWRGNDPRMDEIMYRELDKVTMHWTIIGGDRTVEFYPTTNTVYANKVEGLYNKCARGCGIMMAIEIALCDTMNKEPDEPEEYYPYE